MAKASPETTPAPRGQAGWPVRLAMALVMALAAHFSLSRLGFNPTDDGFILAQSRRLLSGEVPHLDFISIRPVGSALLHIPELLVGADHAFLVSRLVYWLEVATAGWCWLEMLLSATGRKVNAVTAGVLLSMAFMLSSHAFPPMAWHTVDGIWLASLGLLALRSGGGRVPLLGLALIGGASLCKQNFLPLIPLSIFLSGRSRDPLAWLAALSLPLSYGAVVAALGGGLDMLRQLVALRTPDAVGPSWSPRLAWLAGAAILGLAACRALGGEAAHGARGRAWATARLLLGWSLAWGVIAWAGTELDDPHFAFLDRGSFVIAGASTGATLALAWARRSPLIRPAFILLVLGATSMVSLGYQTMAHVAGPLALLLTFACLEAGADRGSESRLIVRLGAVAAFVVIALHWVSARTNYIYNERAASSLTHALDDVWPGGRGLVSNPDMHAVLADLTSCVDQLGGRQYAILVDAPGWWAHARQRNPLPADWPQSIELCNEQLQSRFSLAVIQNRGRTTYIVQRILLNDVASGFTPVPADNLYYGAIGWVRANLRRTGQTTYWDLYE
jgi:hypothetical protein